MNRRIATITFHCSYNYGSALQAYALQEYLKSRGYEVKIIDYYSEDFEQYRIIPRKLSRNTIKRFLNVIRHLPRYLKRRRAFHTFWKTRFCRTKRYTYRHPERLRELNDQFDAFICGSDQIWNLECTHGVEPAYFLSYADAERKKIAYAPSLATTRLAGKYDDELRDALKGFNAISVREASTIPVISGLCSQPIHAVCDPTLLVDSSIFPMQTPSHVPAEGSYIFVYMLGTDRKLLEYIEYLRERAGLPVYYITRWESSELRKTLRGTDLFGISPEEFLYYLRHAAYVVSSSFHATLFSISLHKQFCSFIRPLAAARTEDLLRELGLEGRLYHESFDIDAPIDWDRADAGLQQMRARSEKYLTDALNEPGSPA